MPDPIVVVGAGPVGLTAALLLAHWGVPSIVLDRRPRRDLVGSKAICQARDVLDTWSSLGAGTIAAEGLTWTTARTYYRDRELFSWSFAGRGATTLPPFVNISQARTEEILEDLARASELVELRWDHEVTGLTQDASGVTVTCSGGALLRAPHVLVCAGARAGILRDALGIGFAGRTFEDQFLICDIRADLPGWENERRFYFDPPWNPGRQVLIHPCPESVFRIDWQVPPGFDLAAEEAAGGVDRRIRQIIGDRPYEIVWRSVYRFHSRIADRMAEGRVLLAGDSAHLVAPFGARGLNSGVADAENAAWKLAFVRNGWAPEEILASYHVERHAAARENIEVTDATMRFLVPHTEAEHTARTAALDAATIDPRRGLVTVDSGRFAEPYWYVDSPLTLPQPRRPFAGRPPKGQDPAPGPGIIVPDAPVDFPGVVRLREVVRNGITLLVNGSGAGLIEAVRRVTAAPVTVMELQTVDREGVLTRALDPEDGEVWVIRPDAHIAAVLPAATPPDVTTAVRRMLSIPETSPPPEEKRVVRAGRGAGRDRHTGSRADRSAQGLCRLPSEERSGPDRRRRPPGPAQASVTTQTPPDPLDRAIDIVLTGLSQPLG